MDKAHTTIKKIKVLIADNREIFRFLVMFISLLSFLFLIFYFIEEYLDFIRIWTADIAVFFSKVTGMKAEADGTLLVLKNMDFEIIHECTGIFALMIYFSCTMAYPTKWKNKIIGIAIGFPFIMIMNIFRIIFLIYVADYHQSMFEYVHSYLWQGTFIIFVMLIWLLWIEKVVK